MGSEFARNPPRDAEKDEEEIKRMENSFKKFDKEKLKWALLLKDLKKEVEEVVKVLMHGEEKYGRLNYSKALPEDMERYFDAALRHTVDEGNDQDTGYSHHAHAICCHLMAMHLERKENERDSNG